VYVRGEAYLAAGRRSEAAREFQKLVNNRTVVQNCPLGAVTYLGLGRAYALQADAAKATKINKFRFKTEHPFKND
jgi:hypothetical protein